MYSNETSFPDLPVEILPEHTTSMFVPTLCAVIFVVGIVSAFSRSAATGGSSGSKEPPVLTSPIPFVGHLIGMLRWQVGYMQMLSSKCPSWPAFTLRIFSSRVYVICDPSLIQAAYRNAKAFDFGSFVVESSERLFNISQEGMKIVRGETAPGYDPKGPFLNGNNGHSFLNDDHRIMVEALSPGPALVDLNRAVLDRVAGSLNDVSINGERVGLYRWMRDIITTASAEAIYGPNNPFSADRGLVDALWDFEADMALLMLRLFPTLIAPKAYRGRAAIRNAFAHYYAQGYDKEASTLIRSHVAACKEWGFGDDDIANFEVSTLFLATTNTVSSSFWQLSYILSDPSLVAEIRAELQKIVTRKTSEASGEEYASMDTTLFRSHCPLLVSTFHETLRLVGAATSVRSVVADTTLSSPGSNVSYSLSTPAVIQLPSGITHTSHSIWGADADVFNPTRFLQSTKAFLSKESRRKRAQGYFPFGGGKHLCPGRHFAMTEILSLVGAVVLGFEVEGARVPERAFQKLGTGIRKPVEDVQVNMVRRKEWENVRWAFDLGGNGEIDSEALTEGDSDGYE